MSSKSNEEELTKEDMEAITRIEKHLEQMSKYLSRLDTFICEVSSLEITNTEFSNILGKKKKEILDATKNT